VPGRAIKRLRDRAPREIGFGAGQAEVRDRSDDFAASPCANSAELRVSSDECGCETGGFAPSFRPRESREAVGDGAHCRAKGSASFIVAPEPTADTRIGEDLPGLVSTRRCWLRPPANKAFSQEPAATIVGRGRLGSRRPRRSTCTPRPAASSRTLEGPRTCQQGRPRRGDARKGEVPAIARARSRLCCRLARDFCLAQQRVNDVTEQRRPGELSDNASRAARSRVGAAVRARTPRATEHLDALAQMFVSDVRARCESRGFDTGLTTRRETDRRQPRRRAKWLVLALRVEDREPIGRAGRLGPQRSFATVDFPLPTSPRTSRFGFVMSPRRVRTKTGRRRTWHRYARRGRGSGRGSRRRPAWRR